MIVVIDLLQLNTSVTIKKFKTTFYLIVNKNKVIIFSFTSNINYHIFYHIISKFKLKQSKRKKY